MPYTHITENERYVISHLTSAGFSLREIARRITRHHTTVSSGKQKGRVFILDNLVSRPSRRMAGKGENLSF
jgi:transposase